MTGSHSPDRDDLTEALRIAQRLGVISATELDREITHCERFAAMVPREDSVAPRPWIRWRIAGPGGRCASTRDSDDLD